MQALKPVYGSLESCTDPTMFDCALANWLPALLLVCCAKLKKFVLAIAKSDEMSF
jgi:hypothetical protein